MTDGRTAWAITYRIDAPDGSGRQEVTEILTDAWCRSAGYQPDEVRTPERACWALALLLATHGHDDAELLNVDPSAGAAP
jgi:hypothetical protein